jgi:hypothetical protein
MGISTHNGCVVTVLGDRGEAVICLWCWHMTYSDEDVVDN